MQAVIWKKFYGLFTLEIKNYYIKFEAINKSK